MRTTWWRRSSRRSRGRCARPLPWIRVRRGRCLPPRGSCEHQEGAKRASRAPTGGGSVTTVVVLDYGSGNLRSAQRALARVGADVTVTADLDLAARADGLVVPGVGAYAACMAGIDGLGAGPVVADRVAAGRPVLGI